MARLTRPEYEAAAPSARDRSLCLRREPARSRLTRCRERSLVRRPDPPNYGSRSASSSGLRLARREKRASVLASQLLAPRLIQNSQTKSAGYWIHACSALRPILMVVGRSSPSTRPRAEAGLTAYAAHAATKQDCRGGRESAGPSPLRLSRLRSADCSFDSADRHDLICSCGSTTVMRPRPRSARFHSIRVMSTSHAARMLRRVKNSRHGGHQ
jgi:hypothetical protein